MSLIYAWCGSLFNAISFGVCDRVVQSLNRENTVSITCNGIDAVDVESAAIESGVIEENNLDVDVESESESEAIILVPRAMVEALEEPFFTTGKLIPLLLQLPVPVPECDSDIGSFFSMNLLTLLLLLGFVVSTKAEVAITLCRGCINTNVCIKCRGVINPLLQLSMRWNIESNYRLR